MLRIGFLSTAYHTSHIIRYWNRIKAEWKLYGTGVGMMRGFRDGDIDLGYMGIPPALIGMDRGLDIVCIAGGHVEGTALIGDTRFRSCSQVGLERCIEQLRGARIGVPARGSIHDVILREMLRRYSVDAQILNFEWADQILLGLERRELDIGCGTPALAVAGMEWLGLKLIFHPRELFPFNPSYGILISRELESQREIIREFLMQHESACKLLREDPDSASHIISRSMDGLLDHGMIRKIIELSPRYCSSIPEPYIRSSLEFSRIMRKLGYISKDLDPERIFNLEFIREIHPESHHY